LWPQRDAKEKKEKKNEKKSTGVFFPLILRDSSDHHLDEKKKREEEEDFNIIARFILPSSKSQKHDRNNKRIFSFQKSLRG